MSKHDPLVYAVVLTYDGKRFLEPCFRTLLETCRGNTRLLLVDNGSSDGSDEFVRERFPEVEILRFDDNIGYIRAANAGIRHAMQCDADYVVVCNDDIELIDARWLTEAVALAEDDPSVGIVSFQEEATADVEIPRRVTARDEKYLAGFALFIRMSLLKTLGLFDEHYMQFEVEMDLQARVAMAGYRNVKLNTPVYHLGGGTLTRSSRKTAFCQMASALRYCLKVRHPLSVFLRMARCLDVACNPWPLTFIPTDASHCRMRNTGNTLLNLPIFVRATLWNLVRLPLTLRSRREDMQRVRAAREALLGKTTEGDQAGKDGRPERERCGADVGSTITHQEGSTVEQADRRNEE